MGFLVIATLPVSPILAQASFCNHSGLEGSSLVCLCGWPRLECTFFAGERRMGEIVFQNTLSGRKEAFVPLHPGEVRIYTCGPTVYDFAHIGNFRTFVFQDILRRFLRSRGFQLMQVMNVTDVDDRIIANAAAAGIGIREYTDKYIEAFLADRRAL